MSIVAVAKRAGVSVATVSRVLNDFQNVRAETVEQVRAAIQEIGYKPPLVKRGPKHGARRVVPSCFKRGQIAILTLGGFQQWLGMPVMSSVVAGITRAAKEWNIRTVLDEMPDPQILSPVISRREIDGALVFFMSGLPARHLARLREQIPSVWVMGAEDGLVDVDHVSADNFGIGQIALDYLLKQGCKELAFVTDHPTWAITRLRAQSFANAARDVGRPVSSFVCGGNALQSEAYGNKVCLRETLEETIAALAASRPRPDGLFVPTDLLLTQIYPMLMQHGIHPQRDIRIISCDNENQRLSTLNPRPASIDIRGEEIGRASMRQLVQRLQRPDDPPARVQVAARLAPAPTRGEMLQNNYNYAPA